MLKLSIKTLFLLVSTVLLLFLANGCFYIETPSPPPTTPPPGTSSVNLTAPPRPAWTMPPSASESPSLPNFVSVVAKVKPSVVAITTEVVTVDIFNRPITREGAGSGWIIDSDGIIVTNNHVIAGASSITVTMDGDRAFTANVIGTDALTDLAVLKINTTNLPTVVLGDSSNSNIGEWVLTIGNALGMGITAKEGIISRLGVSIPVSAGQTLYDLIETSAPINPGNSGGPLVNMAGEVLGITSAKLSDVSVEGLGYAISITSAKPIIEGLVQNGYVVRPWLGVSLSTLNQFLVMRYDLAVDKGVLITNVIPESPAEQAGLAIGDVIVSTHSKEVATAQDLVLTIHANKIGQPMEITFYRGETVNTTKAILAESPAS